MKPMTAFAAILAAGMALAPMAASAATITFEGPLGRWANNSRGDEALSGLIGLSTIEGQNTPRNAGEGRACDPVCLLRFQTGELLGSSSRSEFHEENQWPPDAVITEYEWKGGGLLRIFEPDTTGTAGTTLLTGTFAEPVTATLRSPYAILRGDLDVAGALTDVVIDEDLAAFYSVPNRGTGELSIRASGRLAGGGGSGLVFDLPVYENTVTFSPVPVPAALPLMLTALAGLGLIRLRWMHAA